ncbi:MAG: hypothetical protein WCP20_01275 [Desulfuromonadales bacterium]
MRKFFLTITAFLILGTGVALADVEATGEGASRDQALASAMRNVVEQNYGTYITSTTTVIDSQLLEDKIFSHSKGYITRYDIIKEGRRGDGYWVAIRAQVDSAILKDDINALTILRKSVGNPRILVAFSQQGEGAQSFKNKDFITEIYNGIVESLTDKQFRVVDKNTADNFARQVAETHDINTYLNKAADYGLKYNAEYTLLYSVSGEITTGSDKRVKLRIKTRLIDNSRSLEITNKVIEEAGSAITMANALEKVAREGGKHVVDPMIDIIQKNWMDMQQNGALYTVVIDGINDPEEIAGFTSKFERFPLVNDAKEVESGGGKTTFEATYKGKRDQLDRDVIRAAKELGWTMKKIRAEGARSTWKRI